jgi:HAD superfamily hydrolase (TIGR01490 family)
MIPKKAYDLVDQHKKKGDKLLIITATSSFITKPIGKIFGIDDLIGTDPEEVNGDFTGRVYGIPSFQEGKVKRLLSWLKKEKLSLKSYDKTFFYSDSRNDIPLLEKVSNPVAANPDEFLLKVAKEKGWPIINLW